MKPTRIEEKKLQLGEISLVEPSNQSSLRFGNQKTLSTLKEMQIGLFLFPIIPKQNSSETLIPVPIHRPTSQKNDSLMTQTKTLI